MESSVSQKVLLKGETRMFNGNDGILMATAFGNMMADNTFRQIIGMKLLADENKMNDGVGMALIMNNVNPAIKPMVQPPTLNSINTRQLLK